MEIHEIKKNKSRLHRVAHFLLGALLLLAGLGGFAYLNYLAFSSNSLLEIFSVGFADTSLVLVTLDIATSD